MDDLYGEDFKIGAPGSTFKRPVKQQKLESALVAPEPEQQKRPLEMYPFKDPLCCVEMEVDTHVSEAVIRSSVAPAEVSFVAFETDEVSGLSRGLVYVYFAERVEAEKVLAASKLARPVSASKFERLMDHLNLRTRERSKYDREREKGKDRDKERERERVRETDRDRDRKRR